MIEQKDIQAVQDKVEELELKAQELLELSQGVQALERNTQRILAAIAMLRINLGTVDQD
ncbi:MAG: hypothetical protein K9K64_05060 [Desulfohalobiaceae bacterium]|nr:hypothetical protein [Desulfohalobiaceae bacterium]